MQGHKKLERARGACAPGAISGSGKNEKFAI
jgi:hypothetical protein